MAWESIHGQGEALSRIRAAHHAGKLAHAYLFLGPDGVGKRKFAIELAQSLLCQRPTGTLAACGQCPSCLQVLAGTHPDCFTVKREAEANELSVGVIKEFCARLSLKARGQWKVGIVEEADDFNVNAANAFLKPLEEPPPGSLLILLATSMERQLPTILSRCQVIPFRPLNRDDLRTLLTEWGIAEPAEQDRLIRLAGGSPGRALALNDPSLWQFREQLIKELESARPDGDRLCTAWRKFAEEAGKVSAQQRERVMLSLQLLLEHYREKLREVAEDEYQTDAVCEAVEACLEAEVQLKRYLQIALILESLCDKLTKQRLPTG